MIFFLVKVFSKQDHADKLLKGELYSRRLSWFKNLEIDKERGDEYEAASVLRPEGLTLPLASTDVATGKTEEVTVTEWEFASPIVFKPRYFDHVNLFCLYAAQSGNFRWISEDRIEDLKKQIELPERYLEFGKYAVAIINYTEFLKRVKDAAQHNGYHICWDLVKYYDPKIGTSFAPLDLEAIFTKRNKYAYQKEFRIAIETGTKGNEPITLNIGKIDDIAIRLDTSDINRQLSIGLDQKK